MFHESQGCFFYQSLSSHPINATCQWIRNSLSPMTMNSAVKPQGQMDCSHMIPAVLRGSAPLMLTSVACFLSSLEPILLLWQEENIVPLCLKVFQQSLVKCLGTMSFKLQTHLLFLRTHMCHKCVCDRNYFMIRTALDSPPTLVLGLSAWCWLAMPFSCTENSLLCCPTLSLTFQGCPAQSALCKHPQNVRVISRVQKRFSLWVQSECSDCQSWVSFSF